MDWQHEWWGCHNTVERVWSQEIKKHCGGPHTAIQSDCGGMNEVRHNIAAARRQLVNDIAMIRMQPDELTKWPIDEFMK